MSELTDLFGPVIHTYTRAQAITDGVLVDVTETAAEAGFRHPVALTCAVWSEAVAWDPDNRAAQDEGGRLWDVLTMARHAITSRGTTPCDRVRFGVLRVPNTPTATRPTITGLTVHIGPGDSGEPVLTIMLPGED